MYGTIEHLALLANSAREDFAQDWHDAEETGERPDLEPITVEMSVEFAESVIDEIAALQARVAELEAERDELEGARILNRTAIRLLQVQRVATLEALLSEAESIPDYDAGLLNDWGGGNVEWWQDYLRAEIAKSNDHWRACVAHTKEGRG